MLVWFVAVDSVAVAHSQLRPARSHVSSSSCTRAAARQLLDGGRRALAGVWSVPEVAGQRAPGLLSADTQRHSTGGAAMPRGAPAAA